MENLALCGIIEAWLGRDMDDLDKLHDPRVPDVGFIEMAQPGTFPQQGICHAILDIELGVHFGIFTYLKEPPHQLMDMRRNLDINPCDLLRCKLLFVNESENGVGRRERSAATGKSLE